jgi:hypothetical protein
MNKTYSDLKKQLISEGFKQEFPKEDTKMDEDLCKRTKCSKCGTKGLEFVPFVKGEIYRAVSKCSKCSYGMEF